jgi:hypothetical protein
VRIARRDDLRLAAHARPSLLPIRRRADPLTEYLTDAESETA